MNQARRAAREKWGRMIEAQRISGQTVAAYCRDQAITQTCFYAWKRRLQPTVQAGPEPVEGAGPEPVEGAMGFVEVRPAMEAKPAFADGAERNASVARGNVSAIEVCLRGGRRLRLRRGVDRELLIETIGILEGLA